MKVDGREFASGKVDDALQEGAADPLAPEGRGDDDVLDTRLPPRGRLIDAQRRASDNPLGVVLRDEDPRSRRTHRAPLLLPRDRELGVQLLHKSQQIINLRLRQRAKFKISHSTSLNVFRFIRLQRPFQHEQRALDVLLVQDVGEADLVQAHAGGGVEAGGGGHHDGLARAAGGGLFVLPRELAQAPGAEVLGVVDGELGDRVERAHRHGRIAAGNAVHPVDQALTALDILVIDVAGVLLRALDGGFGDHLADEGRRQAGLAELHHRLAHLLVLRDERADADAALGIPLGHRVDEDHVLLDPLQVHRGDIRRARVDELAVHLVGEEVQVVFLDQVADAVHLALGVQVARGVVGVADKDGLRALVDQFLELFHLGEAETFLDGGDDGADHGAGGDGERHVVRVRRFRDDDLVAGVQAAQEREKDRLAAAARDDDLIGGQFDLVPVVVRHKCLAQRPIPLGRAVLEGFPVDMLEGLQRLRGRRQVRLADVQLVDLHAPVLGGIGQWRQLPDRRRRHIHAPLGNVQLVGGCHT